MMKRNLLFILLSVALLGSCSKDEDPKPTPLEEGQTVMLDVHLTVPSGTMETRGGVINENGEPPAGYPLDNIYLVGKTESGSYTSIPLGMEKVADGINLSSIPITTKSDDENFYVSFQGQGNESLTLAFSKSGGMMQSQDIYFSSRRNATVQMNLGGKTPGGKDTYAPIGDILFRNSTSVTVTAVIVGDYCSAAINNTSLDQLKTLTFSMRRNTGVLSTKLIIVNPSYVEDANEAFFTDAMGCSPIGWKCRTYLEGFPLSYDMIEEAMVSGTKGTVNLCDDWNPFIVASGSTTVAGTMTSFKGWGILDTSYPYIYSGSQSGMNVCFSIQAPDGRVKTLKVSSDIDLTPNLHVVATAILYVTDLKEQFKSDTKAVGPVGNTGDEDILDVPYKFYWETQTLSE